MAARGAYGKNLADCFRIDAAPSFVTRSLRNSQIAVTQIVCNIENNGLTAPLPREDAFLVTVQLVDCLEHDLWLDGKSMKTGPLSAGTTCVYDLRQTPIVRSISRFANLHFYFPRSALDCVADGDDTSQLDELPHNPGIGMDDPVIRNLGMSLLPAFERPGEVTALFVDHITTAAAAYVARLNSGARRLAPAVVGGLAPWQRNLATEMLSSRLDGVISIAQLARECGLSARSFSAAFRRSTGVLPHQWLQRHRLERARGMVNSGAPLAEVASSCGFAGSDHLLQVLQQATSPRRNS